MANERDSRHPTGKKPIPSDEATELDLASFPEDSSSKLNLGEDIPVAQAAPASEVFATDPTESIEFGSREESASSSDLFGGKAPAAKPGLSDSNLGNLDSSLRNFDSSSKLNLEEVTPVAEMAPASEVFPLEEPEALEFEIPQAENASSSHLFGGDVPPAHLGSSDSGATNLEPMSPVQPASGWFDSHAEEPLATPSAPSDAIDTDTPSAILGGSDIFGASQSATAMPKSDVSDVIAATAYGQAREAKDRPSAKINASRPSSSTAFEKSSPAPDAPDSLFGEPEAIDLAHVAKTPDLPGDNEADLGSTPVGNIEASSILADLSEHGSEPGDSSAIRLEAPGVEATLRNDRLAPEFAHESTEPDMDLAEGEEGDPDHWHSQSDSNLFHDVHSKSEFELQPDAGAVDPFADDTNLEQPSLSSTPSSIFSGGKIPGTGSGKSSGGSVPIANPDATDSVEFSDHPDVRSADSDSFHALPSGGAVDFDMAEDLHPERSMRYVPEEDDDFPVDTKPDPSRRYRPKLDPTDEVAPVPATPVKSKPTAAKTKDPSMELDWVAEPETTDIAPVAQARPRSRREAENEYQGSSKRGLAGLALGLLLGVGASAGVYLVGIVPNKEEKTFTPVDPNAQLSSADVTGGGSRATASAKEALNSGEPARAVRVLEISGAKSTEEKAVLGQARLFARFRELAQTSAAMKPDDAEIVKARTDLEAVMNDADAAKTPEGERTAVKAALHLGLTYEAAGDRAEARKVYFKGKTRFPKSEQAFQTALDRLDATEGDGNKTSLRLTPAEAEQLASGVVILLALNPVALSEPPAAAEEPAEAGLFFWKAINLAAKDKNFAEAIKQIAEAKKAHEKRAQALAGRGLNPLSDPLEQIFPRCCDELKAQWELRKSLYEHPGIGEAFKKDVGKALDQLAGAEKRAVDAMKLAADLKTTNETLAAEVKTEKEKAVKAEKDLTLEKDKVVKAEKDLTAEKDKVLKVDKDLTAAKAKVTEFEKKMADTTKIVDMLKDTYKKNEAATRAEIGKKDDQITDLMLKQRTLNETLNSLAKQLQDAKLLPEKYDTKELIAATKTAVTRAAAPGSHLLTLVAKLNKAEAMTKAVELKAATEKAEHAAEIKKLVDSHAVELKKSTDALATATDKLKTDHATELKKLNDSHAVELKKSTDALATIGDKLKAEQAAKLKEAADKYALDAKKLKDANAVKVKELEESVVAERRRVDDAERRFKAQLGDAMSPSQQVDLWLAILVELRRPSDADAALDAANKAFKTAEPGSEDAAKAQTLAGLALLLQNDAPAARVKFNDAKMTPAYGAAKGKNWTAALDMGMAYILDPSAISRKPIVESGPKKDALVAARHLDAGISAYKAGRFSVAEKELANAAWHDPNDALAWYFLGATRWALGKTDDAKSDFKQGAEREKLHLVPTRQIDSLIGSIQGAGRDALDAARP